MTPDEWAYYFVNHDTHVVFWIEDFDLVGIANKMLGVTEDSHISELHIALTYAF